MPQYLPAESAVGGEGGVVGFNNHCGACPKCLEPVHSAPYGVLVLCDHSMHLVQAAD